MSSATCSLYENVVPPNTLDFLAARVITAKKIKK
jgi:hypothetical protein